MKAAKLLKQKIGSETVTTGMLATFHLWPGVVETAIKAGLDFLIIDTEHCQFSNETISDVCAIGRMLDFPVLIRPPHSDTVHVRLTMDQGPCGLFLPMVDDVATMQQIQDGAYMPPRGKRRPGGPGNRWVSNIQYANWKTEVEDDLIILPQIESPTGLNNVEAIAAHPLATAIAVGPYDLSAHLGVCWDPESPKLLNALDRIRKAGRAAGKTTLMVGDGPTLRKRGFTFLVIAEAMSTMENALKDAVRRTKAGEAAPSATSERPLP